MVSMEPKIIIKCKNCGGTSFILISNGKYKDKIVFIEEQMLIIFDPHVNVNVYDKAKAHCVKCETALAKEDVKIIVNRIKNGECDDLEKPLAIDYGFTD